MKLTRTALALLLAPLAVVAHAEVTFTPFATYHFFDEDKLGTNPPEVKDEVGYALGLGYRFTPAFGIEALYGRTRSEIDVAGSPEIRDSRVSLDGYYAFNAEGRFSPYILLGGGQQNFKAPGADVDKGTFANAALGAFTRFNDYVALRTEVRDVYNFNTENNDILALVGLEFSGASSRVTNEPTPAPEPVAEEPAAVVVVEEVVAVVADTDGDGVPDGQDKCPNTPAGVQVNQDGCPLDSDKDGVPDYLDKCPGTATNIVVDTTGCPKTLTEAVSKQLSVNFDSGKSVVKAEYKAEIGELAAFIKQYNNTHVEIQGHTDSSGKKALNDKLSQERADAVARVLVEEFGIAASQVTANGYGSSQPLADNATADGRAKNRRVIAILSGEATKVQRKK